MNKNKYSLCFTLLSLILIANEINAGLFGNGDM